MCKKETYEHYKFIAEKGQAPLRIDRFLNGFIPNISRTRIQTLTNQGLVLVNNISVKSNYKVKPNDVVVCKMYFPKRELVLKPENIPLNIVYEDDDVLVINKPTNMVCHPAYGNYSGTLMNAVLYHVGEDFSKKMDNIYRPGLVHRLDKNTTGLLVVAKNISSLNHLAQQFANRTTKRKYVALTWGNIKEDNGIIEGNIGRSLKNRKVMTVFDDGEYGKEAITTYKVIKRFSYVTLIECILKTGRTHQIRAHFKYLKHPLFCDEEYGGNKILKGVITSKYKQFINNCFNTLQRQALHALSLGFEHPKSKKQMFFESKLPDDFETVIKKWETYTTSKKFDI